MIVFMNSAAASLMTTDTEYSVVISGLNSLSSKAEVFKFSKQSNEGRIKIPQEAVQRK